MLEHQTGPMAPTRLGELGTMDKRRRRSARSIQSEANFRTRLAELGATLLEPEWLGSHAKHHVLCAANHDCYPTPHDAQQAKGICKVCARNDPAAAEAAFRARLEELGATLLEPEWLGAIKKHHVRCAAGHDCWPRPNGIQQGQGLCLICVRRDPADAERRFLARLAELGAVPLGPYESAHTAVHVRCAAGHDCWPKPSSVLAGRGPCRACGRGCPKQAEAYFRAALAELGATPLFGKWLGARTPHPVRCANGHECHPKPHEVRKGGGICKSCSWAWDVFYVVTGNPGVKFGITSRDGRVRLKDHRADGYVEVVRLVTGLAAGVALDTENAVKAALAAAGKVPVRGCEYFDASCLTLILDVADAWLSSPAVLVAAEPVAEVTTWFQGELFAA